MKVFLSWSGDRSKALALAIYEWLPLVINAVEPWLSAADIAAGTRWNAEVSRTLGESRVGIFCLTEENLQSPWINFEAGAVAKDPSQSLACTLGLGLTPSQVKWPLAQFQAKETTKEGIFELIQSINSANGTPLLRTEYLFRAFEKWWPELDARIAAIPAGNEDQSHAKRSEADLLEEILLLVRERGREDRSRSASTTTEATSLWGPQSGLQEHLERTIHSLSPTYRKFVIDRLWWTPDSVEVIVRDRLLNKVITFDLRQEHIADKLTLSQLLDDLLTRWQNSAPDEAKRG